MSARTVVRVLPVIVLALGAAGCAQLEHKKDVRIDISGPEEVEAGHSVLLMATTANGIVESHRWRSGDDAIAIVDRAGRVTGRRAGNVTITAIGTVTDQTGKHRLTVVAGALPGTPDAGPVIDSGRRDAGKDAGVRDAGMHGTGGADDDTDASGTDSGADSGTDAGDTDAPSFVDDVHPVLMSRCAACHAPGGLAGGTNFVLVDDAATDHEPVLDLVNTADVESSRLLAKARGDIGHGGGIVLLVTSQDYETLRDWIAAGAAP